MIPCPCARRKPPLRQDPHVLSKRQPSTMRSYRFCLHLLLAWCVAAGVSFETLDGLDDLLVEWKNAGPSITKSKFTNAVTAVEVAIPYAKGQLSWARAVISAWEVVGGTQHHKPLTR